MAKYKIYLEASCNEELEEDGFDSDEEAIEYGYDIIPNLINYYVSVEKIEEDNEEEDLDEED